MYPPTHTHTHTHTHIHTHAQVDGDNRPTASRSVGVDSLKLLQLLLLQEHHCGGADRCSVLSVLPALVLGLAVGYLCLGRLWFQLLTPKRCSRDGTSCCTHTSSTLGKSIIKRSCWPHDGLRTWLAGWLIIRRPACTKILL